MLMGTLNAAWRNATGQPDLPVMILHPEEGESTVPRLAEVEDFCRPPENHPHLKGRPPRMTWQLGTNGYLWLANGYTTSHGDDWRGVMTCPFLDTEGSEWKSKHAPMAFGSVLFTPWGLIVEPRSFWATNYSFGMARMRVARSLLEQHHKAFMTLIGQAAEVVWTDDTIREVHVQTRMRSNPGGSP